MYKIDETRHYTQMRVAGLNVAVAFEGERMIAQTKDYIVENPDWTVAEADFRINVPIEYLQDRQKELYPYMPIGDLEYLYTGSWFYKMLLKHGGCMLHSSAVVVDGAAYLFSADSGTGKSTHTSLWLKHFGDKAYIINDDKPAIRKEDGGWYVYGTPWSGKTDQNVNTRAKLGAVVFIERSDENWITEMDSAETIVRFIKQTTRKVKTDKLESLLNLLDELIRSVPVYKMGCNISDEAVVTAYNKIRVDA